MNKKSLILVGAVIFFIISPSLSFYVVPSMKRIPDDLDKIIYYEGKLGMLNTTTVEMEYRDVEITRHLRAVKEEGNVLLIREDIDVKDKLTNQKIDELCMVKIYGIDPYTVENIEGYGDVDRIGQWIFPIGVEKKNYLVWNSDLDDAVKHGYITRDDAAAIGYFIGEEKRAGVKTYKFHGWQENVFTGYLPELPGVKMFYNGDIVAWVEINTGTIVDLQKHIEQYAEFPDLHKLPSNLNISVFLKGNITMLNTSNAKYERHNIIVCNHVEVVKTEDTYYIIKNEIKAEDENGNEIEELYSYSEDAVDPLTMEFIPMLSDKKGLFTFPIGVEKRNYELWNPDVNDVSTAYFIGEEEIGGIKVYRYEVSIRDYFIGNEAIEGMSDRSIRLYYSGNTTYWVEPNTGYVVYVKKDGAVKASFPDLHTIPENFEGSIKMDGELWFISQPKREIEMVRNVKAEKVYWENGKKILLIKDETNTYDKESGEKIEMACKTEYHGVYADTAEEAKNYGDMEREGIFTFPPGTKKGDYIMWNTEINAPSIAHFVREEDHEGIHTYLFETVEDRIVYDSIVGTNVRYITTTKYWVEPNTGLVIDMKKESVKKINPLEALLGIRGILWIDVYRLNLSFSQQTIKELKEEADKMKELIKLSNTEVDALRVHLKSENIFESIKKAEEQKRQIQKLSGNRVKVLDLRYWMSDRSVYEMAEEAKKISFLLIFMQIIVPAFLVVLGIALLGMWMKR